MEEDERRGKQRIAKVKIGQRRRVGKDIAEKVINQFESRKEGKKRGTRERRRKCVNSI
jgi:hypothetical protein